MSNATASAPVAHVLVRKVADAASSYGRNFANLVAVIMAAGHADQSVQWSFYVGYMAAFLSPSGKIGVEQYDAAAVVLLARNAKGTSPLKPGESRRTPEQERAYASARQVWSRVLKAAGVETADKRGGANNPDGKGAETPAERADVRPTAAQVQAADPVAQGERAKLPKIRKPVEFAHYGHAAAATVLAALDNSKTAEDPRVRALAVQTRDAWAALLAELVAESAS